MTVRVSVPEVWDTIRVEAAGDWTLAQVKRAALAEALGRTSIDEAAYAVKYRGALVLDESQTVEGLALPDGAPIIVLRGHRRPVS